MPELSKTYKREPCQVLFALTVLAHVAYGQPPEWAFTLLGALAFVSTVVSGIDYVLIYTRRAAAVARARAPAH